MTTVGTDFRAKVARCRLLLAMIAIVAVYVDPTEPVGMFGLQLSGGQFVIDPYTLAVLCTYLVYAIAVYVIISRELMDRYRLAVLTAWTDVLLGAAIVIVTEGTSSPFWAFFVFAVIAAGAEGGLRRSVIVTTTSVAIYLSLIVIAWHGDTNVYITRPVYLAVVGYLTAYLGEERLNLETHVHNLESTKERVRIARALHDGCVQTLGGINLTLQTCQEMIREGRSTDALNGLADLQTNINREHDELRAYVRDLAEVRVTGSSRGRTMETRFFVSADFAGTATLVDQVLQLMREAVTNVTRHAQASSAVVSIRSADSHLFITIDDDGVGFPDQTPTPWSIASRVADAGGSLRISTGEGPGAHLRVAIPLT